MAMQPLTTRELHARRDPHERGVACDPYAVLRDSAQVQGEHLAALSRLRESGDIVWVVIAHRIRNGDQAAVEAQVAMLAALDSACRDHVELVRSRVRLTYAELGDIGYAKARLAEDLLDSGLALSCTLQQVLFDEPSEPASAVARELQQTAPCGMRLRPLDLKEELSMWMEKFVKPVAEERRMEPAAERTPPDRHGAGIRAAAEILDTHGDFIRALIRHQVHNRLEEEDLFQEFFLALVRRPVPPDVRNLRSYLYRAVINHVLDSVRARQRYRRAVQKYARETRDLVDNRILANAFLDREAEREAAIAYCARHLREREARAFILKYRDNCTNGEIAAKMGLNVRTVSHYLAVSLERVRAALRSVGRPGPRGEPDAVRNRALSGTFFGGTPRLVFFLRRPRRV
jgi:RNA polymerase sigma factor (sigma-70 family)